MSNWAKLVESLGSPQTALWAAQTITESQESIAAVIETAGADAIVSACSSAVLSDWACKPYCDKIIAVIDHDALIMALLNFPPSSELTAKFFLPHMSTDAQHSVPDEAKGFDSGSKSH